MGRFLIYFSYVGTRYSGAQFQKGVAVHGSPLKTVGGALQEALKRLKPANEIRVTLSSRTDKGVHALKNACHVDLEYPYASKEYNPLIVTNVLNSYFRQQEEDIRVLQTLQVPNVFSARYSAQGRKYVYRLGHIPRSDVKPSIHEIPLDSESFCNEMKRFSIRRSHPSMPLGEPLSTLDACKAAIYRNRLDISKLISAAEMVSGIHNYLSFTSRRNQNADHLPHPVKMLTIGVKRGQPFGYRLQRCGLDVAENMEFWDIHVQSRSFMYRQVRRLVGAMVLVARSVISLDDLRDILTNPKNDFPFSGQMVASECGLFLLDVQYNPKDLEFVQAAQTDAAIDQDLVIPTPGDTVTTPSCDSSDRDDKTNTPSPGDPVVATNDEEHDLISEDDDPVLSVPDKNISSESPEGLSERS